MKKALATLIFVIAGAITHNSFDVNAQMGSGMMGSGGTAWGTGAFRSNGERIYFTEPRGHHDTFARSFTLPENVD